MSNLSQLLDIDRRQGFLEDLSRFVEATIAKQSGITGMTLKGAVSAAKKMNPGILTKGLEYLLPEILGELDPLWQQFENSDESDFGVFLTPHAAQVTSAILAAIDQQAHNVNGFTIAKTYNSLRNKASKIIDPEVPEFGRILHKHM